MTTDLEKNLGLRNSKFHFPEFEGEKALLHLKDESAFKNRQRTLKTEDPLTETKPQVAEESSLPINLVNGTSLSRNDYFWRVTRSHFFTIYERDSIELKFN